MKNKCELTVKQVRALLLVAPKSDIRYYLNGVFIDFGRALAVVTDGHKMVFYRVPECVGTGSVILGRDALETVSRGGRITDVIEFRQEENATALDSVELVRAGSVLSVNPVDGKYPDFARVMPDVLEHGVDFAPAQYDPEILQTVGKCLRALTEYSDRDYPITLHNGCAAGVMYCPGAEREAIGIVMPFRAPDGGVNHRAHKDFFETETETEAKAKTA